MAGLLVSLPGAVTDTSLAQLPLDPLPVAGTILLIDPSNPARATPSTVAAGSTVALPNLASRQALAMGIGTVQSDVDPVLTIGASLSGSVGKMERTSRGGLHGIISATLGDGSTAKSAALDLPTAIKTYVLANPSHSFYFSAWVRYTRSNVSGNQDTDFAIVNIPAGATGNYLLLACGNTDRPTQVETAGRLLGGRAPGAYPVATGNLFRNRAADAWTGTAPVIANLMAGARFGATGFNNTGSNASGYASKILYRLTFEDLTVSGRSYATVDAADLALYTAAFASGGYFNGDTFTDPTTIP